MEILGVTVDLSFWQNFFNLPIGTQAAAVFALGAWVFLAYFFLKSCLEFWVVYRQSIYTSKWQWVLLAVDVPPLFVQTPKAVEQIFAHLTGTLSGGNVLEKFWNGKRQKNFSFEVVSIEGYIQFLIRTEAENRDVVEASIYAQYPEAEITEVEDYVSGTPDAYPNDEYDVMGIEFKLAQPDAYPIRRYPDFAYSLSKEAVFSDPMAAILENFTRIGQGENFWMQIVVEPVGSSWKEKGIALAKSVMKGAPKASGSSLVGGFVAIFGTIARDFIASATGGEVSGSFGAEKKDPKKEEKPEVEPGARKAVEAIEEKIAKMGFKTKIRALYAARKEVYNPSRCLSGIVGAMNQFHVQNHNAIVPFGATSAQYDSSKVKANRLKNSFVKAFKARRPKWRTCDSYILNIEELATVWHFPLPFVKTPLLHKAGHKRAEPPSGLPIEGMESPLKPKLPPGEGLEEPAPPAPEELPYG